MWNRLAIPRSTISHAHQHPYLALWAAIGPLAGIALGHFLTRSWQHQQWLSDNRKQEFRELLTAMSAETMELLYYKHFKNTLGVTVARPFEDYLESLKAVSTCLRDRIYIAEDIKKIDLANRFISISTEVLKTEDFSETVNKLDVLISEVVAVANKG